MPLDENDLLQIKAAFGIAEGSTLKETLGLNEIHDSINEFNNKITVLENSLTAKLTAVEKSNGLLTLTIAEDRTANEKSFNDLKAADEKLRDQVQAKDEEIRILTQRLSMIERRSSHNEQHGRRWNIEIDGIPDAVADQDLESAVLDILFAIGVGIERYEIEAVHRLPAARRGNKPKPTIVRFVSRKTAEQCWSKKSNLRTLDVSLFDFLNHDSVIYFNPSLCAYYKELAFNCRKLKKEGKITKVKVDDNGNISIILLTGGTVKVKHHTDLKEKFPNEQFTFDTVADNEH